VPLDDLFAAPARDLIESYGGAVLLRHSARVVVDADGVVAGVRAGDLAIAAPHVVSTVPWHAFARLWDDDIPSALETIAARAAAMQSSPIVTVNLWLDGVVMPDRFVGLVGRPMHWVFDKSAIFGTSAAHLSVVASGAVELAAMTNDEITRIAVSQLRQAIPEMKRRRVIRAVVVREHRATFSLAPGGPARPPVTTPLRGFHLAGDWIDTGLPATIEGAVLSGRLAAEAIVRS
jgi:predicted NAD/FAD-dependent oxidoreductase